MSVPVRLVICLVNSVNERDLSLLTGVEDDSRLTLFVALRRVVRCCWCQR